MSKKLITMLALGVVGTLTVVTVIRFMPIIKNKTQVSAETSPKNTLPETTSVLESEITNTTQLTSVLESKKPMVLKFYADWCGACTYVNSYYGELKKDLPDIDFYSINIDNQEIMQLVNSKKLSPEEITYLPTFLMIQTGKETKQITGAKKKEDMIAEIKNIFT